MITVILSPFGELIKGEFEPILPEVSVDEDIAIDRIVIEAENELKKTISSAVLARFGMAPEKIELEIRRHGDESGETLELLNVCVTVSGGEVDEIKEYLEAMLFVKVEVILNNG